MVKFPIKIGDKEYNSWNELLRRPDLTWQERWDEYYFLFLESEYWHDLRKEVFDRYGKKCQRCGLDKNLQIHHKTYDRIGQEKIEDLEVVCRHCHEYGHKKKG